GILDITLPSMITYMPRLPEKCFPKGDMGLKQRPFTTKDTASGVASTSTTNASAVRKRQKCRLNTMLFGCGGTIRPRAGGIQGFQLLPISEPNPIMTIS